MIGVAFKFSSEGIREITGRCCEKAPVCKDRLESIEKSEAAFNQFTPVQRRMLDSLFDIEYIACTQKPELQGYIIFCCQQASQEKNNNKTIESCQEILRVPRKTSRIKMLAICKTARGGTPYNGL